MEIFAFTINSPLLTIITIVGSALCAATGILVNRHIAKRQVTTDDRGTVVTNALYWQGEIKGYQDQITLLRSQIDESEKNALEKEKKMAEQLKMGEVLTFKYYQAMVDKNNLQEQLDGFKKPKE